jgi:hypothetical protein
MGTKVSELTAAVALTGVETLPVVQSLTSKKATAAQVKTYVNKNVATALTSAAGVVDIDCSLGDYFTLTLTENVTSITFSNTAGAGYGATKMLKITQHASSAKTVAWPASFKWANGSAGVMSTTLSAIDVLAMTSFDNGTTWNVTLANGFA